MKFSKCSQKFSQKKIFMKIYITIHNTLQITMRVTLTHHLLIVRDTDGHIGSVPSFHFKHVPDPFDLDGRHCSAVLGRQATIRRPEARFRLTTVVVKRVHYTSRSQLTEFPLVGATYERYVVVTNAERCTEVKKNNFFITTEFLFLFRHNFRTFQRGTGS